MNRADTLSALCEWGILLLMVLKAATYFWSIREDPRMAKSGKRRDHPDDAGKSEKRR